MCRGAVAYAVAHGACLRICPACAANDPAAIDEAASPIPPGQLRPFRNEEKNGGKHDRTDERDGAEREGGP